MPSKCSLKFAKRISTLTLRSAKHFTRACANFTLCKAKYFTFGAGKPPRIFHCNISSNAEILLRLLADISENTAVNVKNVTVYKVGSIRGKEYCGTGEVVGISPTCRRCF